MGSLLCRDTSASRPADDKSSSVCGRGFLISKEGARCMRGKGFLFLSNFFLLSARGFFAIGQFAVKNMLVSVRLGQVRLV